MPKIDATNVSGVVMARMRLIYAGGGRHSRTDDQAHPPVPRRPRVPRLRGQVLQAQLCSARSELEQGALRAWLLLLRPEEPATLGGRIRPRGVGERA